MNEKKKINLLPQEIKNKYDNMHLAVFASVILSIFVFTAAVQLLNIGILKWDINRITAKNEKYEREKASISILQEKINEYNEYIAEYENVPFPFMRFMHDMENVRSESVYIISVDTPDRLIDEGDNEEEGNNKEENNVENTEDKDSEKSEEELTQTEEPKIEYTGDLSARNIVIRGYGQNQRDISSFIYELSKLSYIKDAKVSAIEEHKMADGNMYNIFEIIVTGGADNEAVNKG